jgi:hypothetical protein
MYQGVVNGWTGQTGGSWPLDLTLTDVIVLGVLLAIVASVVYGIYWILT